MRNLFKKTFSSDRTRKTLLIYLAVFTISLLIHVVIFRGALAAIPDIVANKSNIVHAELVPFFGFDQFWSHDTSKLTGSDELRVNYSFWTAWVRHHKVLPFALVILNSLALMILFHAFFKIGKLVERNKPALVIAAFLSAAVIHFVLLYSKITHFYVLVIGFSLFAWSLSLVIEQLFGRKEISKRNILVTALIVLLNPAIHYHIIFYFIFTVLFVLFVVFSYLSREKDTWRSIIKKFIYYIVVCLLSGIPYAILILASTSNTGSVATQIPVNYWMIFYSSIGLEYIFSFDTASQIDMYRYGNYIVDYPRIHMIFYTLAIILLFTTKQWKDSKRSIKYLIFALSISMVLAIWMSLGYSPNAPYSFHAILSNVINTLHSAGNFVAELMSKLLAAFINILRFPHRFQFIHFYMAGALVTISLTWLIVRLNSRTKNVLLSGLIVGSFSLMPFVISDDHRAAFFGGNFAGMLTPYSTPRDLEAVKSKLAERDDDKLFIMPTLESGREIKTDNHRYDFIDKFFIYYLNQPTVYYGTGGNTDNKIIASTIYQGLEDERGWWDDVLADSLGVTHILHPQHVRNRPVGQTFMPDIDKQITKGLKESDRYQPSYVGDDYVLYERIDDVDQKEHGSAVVEMEWENLNAYLSDRKSTDSIIFPVQLYKTSDIKSKSKLITDDPEKSFYTLYSLLNTGNRYVADSSRSAFRREVTASTEYTNLALSINTLGMEGAPDNRIGASLPTMVNLSSHQFLGVDSQQGDIDISTKKLKTGKYRLALHVASTKDNIKATINGEEYVFKKLAESGMNPSADSQNEINFNYYTVDIEVSDETLDINIPHAKDASILVELMVAVPYEDIPNKDGESVVSKRYDIVKTDAPFEYSIKYK